MATRLLLITAALIISACTNVAVKKNWNATDYKNNSSSQMRAAQHALKRITFQDHEHVLDVGCGDGKITTTIADQVRKGRVLGVDLSETMIDFAKTNLVAQKNLNFEQMDAAKINFHNQFDTVVSFSAMQWVQDQTKAMQGIFNALKPNGQFLMMIPAGYPPALKNSLDEMMANKKWQPYFVNFKLGQVFYTKDEYEIMLKKTGFSEITCELIPAYDRFENSMAFSNFVRQWLPHLVPVPKDKHDSFMNELMNRYAQHEITKADGSVWFNKYSLEVLAKKGTL